MPPMPPAPVISPKPRNRRRRVPAKFGWVLVASALVYLVLLIPEAKFETPKGAGKSPFIWNQDALWTELQEQFLSAKQANPTMVSNQLVQGFVAAHKALDDLKACECPPGHGAFASLETQLFGIAPLVAASPGFLGEYAALIDEARLITKKKSEAWDLNDPKARQQLYRILFGGRTALDLTMVQSPIPVSLPSFHSEPSDTPSVVAFGTELHSGDIFVSRGGAPTSSLISRGNDFPGNFSHVALLHIDPHTREATIIESLIERGVVTVPLEEFLKDQRLRLMTLRMRADHPVLRAEPQLPHRAAALALSTVRNSHIPYDFSMDFHDHGAQFCAEVVSSAYEQVGVRLWMGMSYISSPTIISWLSSVGARHFETQEPSDLEYDPQLRVVAEWRNSTNVFQAHLDDAVTDTMFETAKPGTPLPYNRLLLPMTRIIKCYNMLLNKLGKEGRIPEGMSATSALRVDEFQAQHRARKRHLATQVAKFQSRKSYLPPYWELLSMAKPSPPSR